LLTPHSHSGIVRTGYREAVIDDGLRFPPGFTFGTATASYQVEGGVTEDGRGPSVWDTFSHTPGTVRDGDTGDTACDSYHRYGEDVELMRALGVGAYRFSISWSRVLPTGAGQVNQAGLDYYRALLDRLREAGIEPAVTLYHWDTPQALQDTGGWMNRDTAARFADYATVVGEALGDRVARWITLNEPVVVAVNGHIEGSHAPGLRLGLGAFPVAHHQLLGHGLAVAALRAASPGVPVGITNNYGPVLPASGDEADVAAAGFRDALHNLLFTDPVLLGRYPAALSALAEGTEADLPAIAAPIDFLGVNYYFPEMVRADPDDALGSTPVEWPDAPRTDFGWPVVPAAFTTTLTSLKDRYGDALPPIHITENGAAYPDRVEADGTVPDPDRIAYFDGHLRAVRAAMDAGVDVRAYYAWSLLDNFEWAEGFSKRFGLVHVDFGTLARTPKQSYGWYRDLIRAQHQG
jgi:beta-glucosidase